MDQQDWNRLWSKVQAWEPAEGNLLVFLSGLFLGGIAVFAVENVIAELLGAAGSGIVSFASIFVMLTIREWKKFWDKPIKTFICVSVISLFVGFGMWWAVGKRLDNQKIGEFSRVQRFDELTKKLEKISEPKYNSLVSLDIRPDENFFEVGVHSLIFDTLPKNNADLFDQMKSIGIFVKNNEEKPIVITSCEISFWEFSQIPFKQTYIYMKNYFNNANISISDTQIMEYHKKNSVMISQAAFSNWTNANCIVKDSIVLIPGRERLVSPFTFIPKDMTGGHSSSDKGKHLGWVTSQHSWPLQINSMMYGTTKPLHENDEFIAQIIYITNDGRPFHVNYFFGSGNSGGEMLSMKSIDYLSKKYGVYPKYLASKVTESLGLSELRGSLAETQQ